MAIPEAIHAPAAPPAPARTSSKRGVRAPEYQAGKGLGWFSIGLGLAQVIAPGAFARMIGARPNALAVRLVGVRELTAGIGLLTQPDAPAWRWARVAGDAMDLALLGGSATREGSDRRKLSRAALAVLGVTAVDLAAGIEARSRVDKGGRAREKGVVKANVVIDRSPEECYLAWLDLSLLARAMTLVQSIRATGEARTHWTMSRMDGKQVEWDNDYTERVPNQRVAWMTAPGSAFQADGRVTFEPEPGGRGTIVRLETRMEPTGGLAGRLFGKVKAQKDLHRFKQLLETGTIARSDGQPTGPRSPAGKLLQKGEK